MAVRFAFRWFGDDDPVPLAFIRQIPCVQSIVSACYSVPSGEVWPWEQVEHLRSRAAENGLSFDVVEGLPVHESIKLGTSERDRYIQSYKENLRQLGEAGIRVVCYNFMPLFGWLRTDHEHALADGSTTTAFDISQVSIDRLRSGECKLPGWHFSTQSQSFDSLRDAYAALGDGGLQRNLYTFLDEVVPAAEAAGVRLAIHPDDPPVPLFGLPRAVSNAEQLQAMFDRQPGAANGMTLCTGSFASAGNNDVPGLARRFARRVAYVHARQVRRTGPASFVETAHPSACGDLDMAKILRALREGGFNGYIRSDHGRMIWGECGLPGYGLYDRALGISYLSGLWEGLEQR